MFSPRISQIDADGTKHLSATIRVIRGKSWFRRCRVGILEKQFRNDATDARASVWLPAI